MNVVQEEMPVKSRDPDLLGTYVPGRFVIFLHIQKTAGSTVQRYLRKKFGPGFVQRVCWRLLQDTRLSDNIITAARARRPSDGFFVGHFCFGMHQHLPSPATYMTFFRDPVERYLSLYNYSRHTPDSYYHEKARRYGLEDFFKFSQLMELDNGMVRFIYGSKNDHFLPRMPIGSVDEEILQGAKENLDNYFFFVGFQDAFDASFMLLCRKLGDAPQPYLALNAPAQPRPEVSAAERRIIERGAELDCALYDHARRRFQLELLEVFPNLSADLEAYRTQKARYTACVRRPYSALQVLRRGGLYGG